MSGAAVRARFALKNLATVAGSIPNWLRALTGWRRWLTAAGLGVLSIFAMAPFHASWVLAATLPGLVWLLDGAASGVKDGGAPASMKARIGAAASIGWWFGFGYHAAGLFWIGEAFLVEAEIFAWLLPFAVTSMPAGLALFLAAATAAASAIWPPGWSRVCVLALAVSAAEWLRGHILTGFPWNVLGYALTDPLPLLQAVSVFGIYGLTLIVVMGAALPLVMLDDHGASPRGLAGAGLSAVALAALWMSGAARLATPVEPPVEGVRIRIVQPSIPQREKWLADRQRDIFFRHLDLMATAPDGHRDDLAGITHVVWPEAAMPFQPLRSPEALARIGERLGGGRWLIAGALRTDDGPDGSRRAFNSLVVFGADGLPHTIYDKIHLVPFGEYLPFQSLLESIGLQQLTRVRGGFSIGVKPRPLINVPQLPPAGPLICYEAIFPAAVVQTELRPELLINVTNDGWFGRTTGPRQHFHQSRVRAVEEGIPLLRAANNGISGFVDPYGRVLAKRDLDEVGTLDAELPRPLTLTIYARLGDIVFLCMWVSIFLTLIIRRHITYIKCSVETRVRF